MNVTFPLYLTRPLLPILRRTAKHGPVLVAFIGSQAAVACPPRLAVYAGSKAFLEKLSRGLDIDERVWDESSGVRFQHFVVGPVLSNSYRGAPGVTAPTAKTFAKAAVGVMGCGQKVVIPWIFHAIMQWSMGLIGEEVIDRSTSEAMQAMFQQREKEE